MRRRRDETNFSFRVFFSFLYPCNNSDGPNMEDGLTKVLLQTHKCIYEYITMCLSVCVYVKKRSSFSIRLVGIELKDWFRIYFLFFYFFLLPYRETQEYF